MLIYSCHQRSRSFWSAPRIATSGKVQHRESVILGLPVTLRMLRVKSDKSDWLRIQNDYSVHVQKSGPSQKSRFLVLAERSAVSGDESDWLRIRDEFSAHAQNIGPGKRS